MPSFATDFLEADQISENLLQKLNHGISVRKVKKGEILQRTGGLCLHQFYVLNGLLRSYVIDEKGKEHTYLFAPEGWMVGDLQSTMALEPAVLFVEALEDSEIEVIEMEFLQALRSENPEMLSGEFHRLQRRIGVLQKRVIMLLSASAQERYEAFIEKYPRLFQRVPQKMIASYLGITPQALSTIRRKIVKGEKDD